MSRLSIFLLTVGLCIGMSNALLGKKNHVSITNALQHNKFLMVHCKSRDDDLLFHNLPPGEHYEFGFHDNVSLSTLFWCNLWQGPHYKHHQVFVAYRSIKFIPQFGHRSSWEAREDGIYLYLGDKNWVLKYSWDTPHEAISPSSSADEDLSPN